MTNGVSLEVVVEEPSAAEVLGSLLPKIVPGVPFEIRVLRGKDMLLKELPDRLRGYAGWIDATATKVVILVDRDADDCVELKARLADLVKQAGLRLHRVTTRDANVLLRIVIEELEAWFFGDVPALCRAYPKVPRTLAQQAAYRDPDRIAGGTWEALARVLNKHGYHTSGLLKLRLAADVAPHMDVESNRSESFQVFRDGLRRLVSEGSHA
ncbi:MAG TPA: DUF4276 family protein [Pseudonocardiaceae bacterium]|nr:DUF4276 family protein [Pseudonocardiaceae bacterium]